MSGFWLTVSAIGAAQGLFLCGALLLRRDRHRDATFLLAGLVGVATTMILVGSLVERLPLRSDHILVFLNINTELAIGPLMLLFASTLADPARRVTRRDARHFVPALVMMALWAMGWWGLAEAPARLAFLASPVVSWYMVAKLSWLCCYAVATVQALRDDAVVATSSQRRRVTLSWLRHAVLALCGMAVVIYAVSFAERFGVDLPFGADPFANLVLAVMIYLASLMVVQQPWVLSLRPRVRAAGQHAQEARRLTTYLDEQRPWMQPDLSLGALSEALGSSEAQLTAVLRDGLDTSFYALMNRYRLAEFERLARDPDLRDRSILELVYQAGFNSKAAFYRVFRDSHQQTPTAFRESHLAASIA